MFLHLASLQIKEKNYRHLGFIKTEAVFSYLTQLLYVRENPKGPSLIN